MTDSIMLEKAIDAIVVLNAAFNNIRLYPPTSTMISKSIDSAGSIFQEIFEQRDSLVLAESENNLIISGHRLDEKDSKRLQVNSFIQLMLKLGIKSITFKRGLTKSELFSFLEVMTKNPEDLKDEGGIRNVMSGKNIRNIYLEQTQNIEMEKGMQIEGAKNSEDLGASNDKRQLLRIKSGIESIIKGEDRAFRDRLVMQALPPTVLDLIARGKEKTAHRIINRLGDVLLNEKEAVRGEASLAFARIGAKLLSEKREDDMIRHLPKLVKWINFETLMLPAYKHIANQLQVLSQHLILKHRLVEAVEVIKLFHMINTGEMEKNEIIKAASGNVLQGLARKEIINSLLNNLKKDENQIVNNAAKILVYLGPNAVPALIAFLSQISAIDSPGDFKDTTGLQQNVCDVLGRIGSQDAVPALKAIFEQADPSAKTQYDDEVRKAAGNALEMISRIHIDKGGTELHAEIWETETPSESEMKETETKAPADDEYSRQMVMVDQHVRNSDTGSAVKLLFDMIVKYAGEKDFEKAEELRDRLMDIDPMALHDIIKSGEIIEEEKNKSIDQAHLDLWSELYKTMTQEETSTLFFAMKSVKFDPEHIIFRKGNHDSKLYFINKGRIKLVVNQGDKEILVKELKPGDMLGEDSFFSLSVCTTTAITLSPVELNYLEKDILVKWDLKSYGIEPKLHDYYLKTKQIDDISGDKDRQRRVHKRIPISGKVKVQAMDSSGAPIGDPIIGALSDISQGGMSFYLNIKKDKVTKMFNEHKMNLKFSLMVGGSEQRFDQNGIIVAAIPHYYDYSIHVKFDNKLDKQIIDGITHSNTSGEGELEILTDS